MSRATRRGGMQTNVQIALGILPERRRPHAEACICGVEREIGTDREVRGLAPIGRMIEWCPRCNRAIKVYPGPRMLTREDKELDVVAIVRKDGKTYRITPKYNQAAAVRLKKNGRRGDPGYGGAT